MRAVSRRFLAPLVMAAALVTISTPALVNGGHAGQHTAALARSCPPGTNWDTIKQVCR